MKLSKMQWKILEQTHKCKGLDEGSISESMFPQSAINALMYKGPLYIHHRTPFLQYQLSEEAKDFLK